jgi:phage repressor protein C with HTH and peptisase S24 domain
VVDVTDKATNSDEEAEGPSSRPTSTAELGRFAERLRSLVGDKSARGVANKIGISVTGFNAYLAGDSDPSRGNLIKIASFFGVDVGWLATGGGAKHLGPVGADPEFAFIAQRDVDLSAGPGAFAEHEPEIGRLAFRRDWLRKLGVTPDRCVIVRVRGDSMEPALRDGALVLVNTADGQSAQDGIYALMLDGGLIVKRLQRAFSGGLIVHSDNPAYRDMELTADQVEHLHVIGRVLWVATEI